MVWYVIFLMGVVYLKEQVPSVDACRAKEASDRAAVAAMFAVPGAVPFRGPNGGQVGPESFEFECF